MATEVGAAYVRLLPSMQGFTPKAVEGIRDSLETAGDKAGDAGGNAAGSGFMDKLKEKLSGAAGVAGRMLGKTVKYAGFAGAAVAAVVGKAGITRLVGLENANQALKQMGLNAGQMDSLMADLLKTLRGTPYALNDGASAMANMVSSGTPLKKVNRYMKMMVDSAAFAQAPLNEVARVFQKIQSQGKIQGDEVMSLAEMGLPAFQVLAKGTGKSIDDLQKHMKSGKFTADEFFAGWEKGSKGFGKQNIKIAGAAKSAGDTTEGAFANMKAAAGRLGAMILGRPFANTKTFFNNITTMADNTTEKLRPWVAKVHDALDLGKAKVKKFVMPLAIDVKKSIDGIDWQGIGLSLKNKFSELGGPIALGFQTAVETGDFKPFGKAVGKAIGDSLGNISITGLNLMQSFGQFLAGVDWFQMGRNIGKEAFNFVTGFVIGLFADTDWKKVGKNIWENRGAVIMAALFVTPFGKALGLAGKLISKVPGLKWLGSLVGKIGGLFVRIFKPLRGAIFGTVKAIFKGVGMGILKVFPQTGWAISRLFNYIKVTVMSRAAGLAIVITNWFKSLPGKISGLISRAVSGITVMFIRMFQAAKTGVWKVVTVMTWMPRKILGALVGIGTLLVGSGIALIEGFMNGIKDKALELPGLIKDKVVGGVKGMIEGVTGFDIGSPSKVTERYGEWVAIGFAEGLRNGAKETRDALRSLIDQLKKDGYTETLAIVEGIQKNLTKKLKERDLIGTLDTAPTKLEKAREKLDKLKDSASSFKDTVKSAFRELGNVSDMEVNNFAEMLSTLKNNKKQANAFTAVMAKLQKMGLNKTTLDELYQAGPEALKNAQMILSGGRTGIAQLNQLITGKGGILAAGNATATQGYNYFYKAGVDSAQGLLDGLVAKHKELSKAIKNLSNLLVSELKRKLGIQSPSTVFRALGVYVPAGFAEGILGGTPEVLAAMQRMITTPAFSQASMTSLPGLPNQMPAGVGYSSLGSRNPDGATVLISGDGLNRKLLEWLREAVRVEGGNVQQVLGSGRGSN